MNENANLFVGLIIILLLVNVIGFGFVLGEKKVVQPEPVIVKYNDSILISQIDDVQNSLNGLNDEIFKIDRAEDYAEALVIDEMDTRDFYKDLFNILESKTDIEEYKDIYDLKIKDVKVNVYQDDATVYVEFKVYYYLDGDEEEVEKALFKAKFLVEDLEADDNFEDAEIEDYSINLVKIYN